MRNKQSEQIREKDPFADKVKCGECKHWIDRSDAQIVLMYIPWKIEAFFCPMHKKPYSSMYIAGTFGVQKHTYYGTVAMDEAGTPAGYKKIEKK